jgi:hypothetical protein
MTPVFRKIVWTEHSKIKMKQYGLSVSKLLGILRKPERKEQGIVSGTTAVMKTNLSLKKPLPLLKKKPAFAKATAWRSPQKLPGEIWLMYKDRKKDGENIRKIISAWRYPGVSKPGETIPVPEDIKQELLNNNLN